MLKLEYKNKKRTETTLNKESLYLYNKNNFSGKSLSSRLFHCFSLTKYKINHIRLTT